MGYSVDLRQRVIQYVRSGSIKPKPTASKASAPDGLLFGGWHHLLRLYRPDVDYRSYVRVTAF
jgi:hypothetical protein